MQAMTTMPTMSNVQRTIIFFQIHAPKPSCKIISQEYNITMAQDLQTNCDSNLDSEYSSLRRINQDDQNVSFGKFSEKTYAYVYET
jgi:hypothetical protein